LNDRRQPPALFAAERHDILLNCGNSPLRHESPPSSPNGATDSDFHRIILAYPVSSHTH
jgi:hypothetical protein